MYELNGVAVEAQQGTVAQGNWPFTSSHEYDHYLQHILQFTHGVINGLCEKEASGYEVFAKQLQLSDYVTLKAAVVSAVRKASRDLSNRKDVSCE